MDMTQKNEQSLLEKAETPESAETAEPADAAEPAELPESAESPEPADAAEPADVPESAENPESAESPESAAEEPPEKRDRKKAVRIALIAAAAAAVVLAVVLGFAASFMEKTTRPVTAEVGETPDLEAICDSGVLRSLYEIEPYTAGTAVPGDYPVTLRFFGFLERELTVQVRDTTAPELVLQDVYLLAGTPFACGDFVVSCTDDTGAGYEFDGEVPSAEEAGEYEIGITASDDYGNSVRKTAVLRVWDESNMVSIDLNATELDVIMKKMFPEITAVDLDNVDTDTFGEYALRAVSDLGVYLWRVNVTDTTAPQAKRINLCSRVGETVPAERFVTEITDVSPCTVSYDTEPDFEQLGFQKIGLNVDDAFGNRTTVYAKLLISGFPEVLQVEYGSTMDEVTSVLFEDMEHLRNSFTMTGAAPDLQIGTGTLRYETLCGGYDIKLDVKDTTPPVLRLKDVSVYKGDPLELNDFIDGYDDLSAVTCSFEKDPPADVPGKHRVTVTASDAYGNKTSETAELEILTDTTPPVIRGTKDRTIYEGDSVSFLDGVSAEDDRSGAVEVKADSSAADLSKAGTYPIHYSSTDDSGNTATVTVTLTVVADTTPPVIYGAKNMTIFEGETVSFRKGVYAEDNRSGSVDVKADSSAVNTYAAGTYPVHYTSTDASGNTANVTVYLTVQKLTIESVYGLADQILAQITTPYMSAREKAWAVYSWCTGNLQYSTRTSYLMGQYVNGAYSGFTIRSGNCYIYYAVASALLTRAGLENIEVQRNDPNNPHYWNLVNVDGSWYHFDTCPHYAGHELQCFLLTDADVRAYSEYEVANYYSFDANLYPATP